jgi:hypothetical protein
VTMSLKLKMIITLRTFKRAVICPILIAGTRVMLVNYFSWERVLVKASSLDSQVTDPKSQTVLLTTAGEQTYVQNFSSLGAKSAEK